MNLSFVFFANIFVLFAVKFFTAENAMMAQTCLPAGRVRKVYQ